MPKIQPIVKEGTERRRGNRLLERDNWIADQRMRFRNWRVRANIEFLCLQPMSAEFIGQVLHGQLARAHYSDMIAEFGRTPDTRILPMLSSIAANVRGLLAKGGRTAAILESRRAVALFPRSAQSHRLLSHSLSFGHLYRNDENLRRQLLEKGAISQAFECSRAAMNLPDRSYEDFLQAGYCLTALQRSDEATSLIRVATDMKCQAEMPALFAGMDHSWKGLVPRFLIIGAAKAGTTSLYQHLCKHPRVLPGVSKEVAYFSARGLGREWYLAHFPRRPDWETRFFTGEASVANFNSVRGPFTVSQELPDVRLIALIRNPIDRAISHYYNDLAVGVETRSLDDAIEEELSYLDCADQQRPRNLEEYQRTQRHYLDLSLYASHLEHWQIHFPPERVLVIVSEEIHAHPDKELRRVFKHIDLKYQQLGDYIRILPGIYDDQQKDRVRTRLSKFFRRHNERLFDMLGRRLDW